jgi:hypothetical protein
MFGVPPSRFQDPLCHTPLCISASKSAVDLTAAAARSASGVVTMSIHKLTAGSGYDYLTRQVAALDATEKGHLGLASMARWDADAGVKTWAGLPVDADAFLVFEAAD